MSSTGVPSIKLWTWLQTTFPEALCVFKCSLKNMPCMVPPALTLWKPVWFTPCVSPHVEWFINVHEFSCMELLGPWAHLPWWDRKSRRSHQLVLGRIFRMIKGDWPQAKGSLQGPREVQYEEGRWKKHHISLEQR